MPESDEPLMVVAVAALLFHGDRFLSMRRAAWRDAGPGLWETLSGRVRPDEEPVDAVRREIAEESGLDVSLDPRPVTAYRATRLGLPMVVIVYRGRAASRAVRLSDEHDDFEWLTVAQFEQRSSLTPLAEAARLALRLPWPEGAGERSTDTASEDPSP